ncbi:protein of unknown function [Cupriavidus taiwanensis]|nr:hypothetical protein CBM2597_A110020 [Cupriavidus taiwanensis]SPD41120.1 protein of unknown function [Cupriavidus taiwanensis]
MSELFTQHALYPAGFGIVFTARFVCIFNFPFDNWIIVESTLIRLDEVKLSFGIEMAQPFHRLPAGCDKNINPIKKIASRVIGLNDWSGISSIPGGISWHSDIHDCNVVPCFH